MPTLVLIATAVSAAGVISCAQQDVPLRNVVIIGLDTVRYDAFWLPNSPNLEDPLTPWLERAERYRQARSPSPWTLPSIASVLTAHYPRRHGAGWYRGGVGALDRKLPPPLSKSARTLSERLRGRGMQTGMFVVQAFFHPRMGLTQGFELQKHFEKREAVVRAFDTWLGIAAKPGLPPFFGMLHFLEAHREHMRPVEELRLKATEISAELRKAAHAEAPAGICEEAEADACLVWTAYVHAVWKLRASVANVLQTLVAHGVQDDTLVILYSDHGEEFFDHRAEQVERGTNPRTVRGFGHGHTMYDELLHVPLVVWDPRGSGADHEQVVSLVDITPTVLTRLGLEGEPDEDWDGVPLEARQRDSDSPVYASAMAVGPEETVVVRQGWKLIERTLPDQTVLYDLSRDPKESGRATLAGKESELSALLRSHRARSRAPEPESLTLPREDVEALQALGYLEDQATAP